jgi:hypothetical protein
MIRAKAIKEKYPHVTEAQPELSGYCVGGAFLMFLKEYGNMNVTEYPFPHGAYIADILRRVNPMLPWDRAIYYGSQITHWNDASRFDEAWDMLDEALTFGQPPCPISELQEESQEELVCV